MYSTLTCLPKTGVPDAPKMPVVKEVYKDTLLLTWVPPFDGGTPITNYIVEKKEARSSNWVCEGSDCIPVPEFWVPELLEGCEYEFRVIAENAIGVGDPSQSTRPIPIKDPIGMYLRYFS